MIASVGVKEKLGDNVEIKTVQGNKRSVHDAGLGIDEEPERKKRQIEGIDQGWAKGDCAMDKRVSAMEKEISVMRKGFSAMVGDIGAMRQGFGVLVEGVSAIEKGLSTMEKRLNAMDNNLSRVREEVLED